MFIFKSLQTWDIRVNRLTDPYHYWPIFVLVVIHRVKKDERIAFGGRKSCSLFKTVLKACFKGQDRIWTHLKHTLEFESMSYSDSNTQFKDLINIEIWIT